MKLFTAITLGLLSLNAMALPILKETFGSHRADGLYGDHEDEEKAYYIPGNGQIFMGYGSPMFSMNFWGNDELGTIGGTVSGYFNIEPHDYLRIRLQRIEMMDKNIQVWIMPISHKFYDFKETAGMFENVFDSSDSRVDFGHAFNATLTEKGMNELPELLRNKTEEMTLFSICYEIKGVSPFFGGSISMNPSKIYRHFVANLKNKKDYTRVDLRTEVQAFIKKELVKVVDTSGDAHMPDYEMAAVDIMIQKMFKKDQETRKFSLDLSKTVSDVIETTVLKGRQEIERVICSDVGVSDLKNYPDLIKDKSDRSK